MISDRRAIEMYLPHHCAAQICWNLLRAAQEDSDQGEVETIKGFIAQFIRPILALGREKLNRRFMRATDLAMGKTYEKNCGLALVSLTHLMQELLDADKWEPDLDFSEAWNELGTAVYDRCGNGALLNEVDEDAKKIAEQALLRLQLEGYYR